MHGRSRQDDDAGLPLLPRQETRVRHDYDPYWWDRSNAPTPEEYRRWNLADTLAQIDETEQALIHGCNANDRCIHLARLAGRTPEQARVAAHADRKSVVQGKSVSVRVEPGGRRSIKTQTK